jgi:hypothetical protein
MGENLSITLISALPEDLLSVGGSASTSRNPEPTANPETKEPALLVIENPFQEIERNTEAPTAIETIAPSQPLMKAADGSENHPDALPETILHSGFNPEIGVETSPLFQQPERSEPLRSEPKAPKKEDRPFAEFITTGPALGIMPEPDPPANLSHNSFISGDQPKHRASDKPLWGKSGPPSKAESEDSDPSGNDITPPSPPARKAPATQLKLDPKFPSPQSELPFDNAPKGRFEGENPNVFDGEDLDLPPFLRKKKS